MGTKLTPDVVSLSGQGVSFTPTPYVQFPTRQAGAGMGNLLDVGADILAFFAQAKNETKLAEYKADTTTRLNSLAGELEMEPDPDEVERRWAEGVTAIKSEYDQTIGTGGGMYPDWQQHFLNQSTRLGIGIEKRQRLLIADKGLAALTRELDTEADGLNLTDSPEDFAATQERGLKAILRKVDAGILSESDGEAQLIQWEDRLAQLQVRKSISNNPAEALATLRDQKQFTNLAPEKRMALIEEAKAAERSLVLEAERSERKLNDAVKDRQRLYAQDVLGAIVKGEYTLADWQRDNRQRKLPLNEAKAFYSMLQSGSAAQSDPSVKLGIIDSITQGMNQRQEILQAVKMQELSYADAMTLLEKNSQKSKASGPLSSKEYTEANRLLSRVFGQGGDKWDTGRQERYAIAVDELMQTVLNGSEEDAIPTARKILTREMRRGVSRPLGYAGELTQAGLEEYKQQLVQQQENNPMPAAKFDGIIRQIDLTMTKILRIQEIDKTLGTVEK